MAHEARSLSTGMSLILMAITLTSCDDDGPAAPSRLAACDASPGSGRPVLPLLQSPFSGRFPMGAFFDHDLPITFDTSSDTNGYVLTFCGERSGGPDGHPGYDWALPPGTPLLAVADGEVLQAGEGPPQYCQPLGRTTTGLLVVLGHDSPTGEPFVSLVGHLSEVFVAAGERVRAGQRIGLSGNTGCSLGPHLHFEVGRVVGTRRIQIDPYGWKGMGTDPWEAHPNGAASIWLWKEGEAPSVAP